MKYKILLEQTLSKTDAVIIKSDINRYFFSGVNSSNGVFLLAKGKAYLFVDFRYFETAKKRAYKGITVVLVDKMIDAILKALMENSCKTVMFEYNEITLSDFMTYKNKLTSDSDISIIEGDFLSGIISKIRMVKDEEEIKSIKIAQQMTDETFTYIINKIHRGMTEKDIALDMEFYMRKLGSEGVSFPFIVLSGRNTSLPHGEPSGKELNSGDFLLMDFGAVYNGYHSDMTRTITINSVTNEQRTVYNTVLKAQKDAIKSIRVGAVCKSIDKIARTVIDNAGYVGCFGHSLGHSLGLDIHENPSFNTVCETILSNNMLLTVEPGIYLENKFGVRIEDIVIIKDEACINITKSNKELIIV